MTIMGGYEGELIFYWLEDGIHLWLRREWLGPSLEPGREYQIEA